MDYLEWNKRIAKYFFRPEFAQQPVCLAVTPELLRHLAPEDVSDPQGDFIAACKRGINNESPQGICHRALEAYRRWNGNAAVYSECPPVIGYLGFFVLVAGLNDDVVISEAAYYARLRELLNQTGSGTYPTFDQMCQIWDAVRRWSLNGQHGSLGILLHNRTLLRHVGWPKSHALLREQDRKDLPRLFHQRGFRPERPPRDEALWRALATYPWTRSKTQDLFTQTQDVQRQLLLEIVLAELARFDPDDETLWGQEVIRTIPRPQTYDIRLCLTGLNKSAGRVSCRVRIFSREGRLPTIIRFQETGWECGDDWEGWSTYLEDTSSGDYLNGANPDFGWQQNMTIPIQGGGRATRIGRSIIFFEKYDGDWRETSEVPAQGQFLVVCHTTEETQLRTWGCRYAAELRPLPTVKFCSEWRLYEGYGAQQGYFRRGPLTLDGVSLHLRGVRLGRGNEFFQFFPPTIEVAVPDLSAVDLSCTRLEDQTEYPLRRAEAEPGVWHLGGTPTAGEYLIIARHGEDQRRIQFCLRSPDGIGDASQGLYDGFGRKTSEAGEVALCGARVFRPKVHDMPALRPFGSEFFYVGRNVGELSDSRHGRPNFRPVWAIRERSRDEAEAKFVGEDVDWGPPHPDRSLRCWQMRDEWKQKLRERRIIVRGSQGHAELMKSYTARAARL